MRLNDLGIDLSTEAGMPVARLACDQGWELLEYLHASGLTVTCRLQARDLLVCFHHTDKKAAERMLETWVGLERIVPVTARSGVAHPDLWLVG